MEQFWAKIVGLLLVSGSGLPKTELARLAGAGKELTDTVHTLREKLGPFGLTISEHGEMLTLTTSPEIADTIRNYLEQELRNPLSKTALETLAIVLYKGPVTRSAVDYVRGVNSSYTLQSLLARNIIERKMNPHDSRSYVYEISGEFLRYLGILEIKQLPGYQELHAMREKEIKDAVAESETHP